MLDLGCGPALFLRDLGERYPAATLYGYDVTPAMVTHGQATRVHRREADRRAPRRDHRAPAPCRGQRAPGEHVLGAARHRRTPPRAGRDSPRARPRRDIPAQRLDSPAAGGLSRLAPRRHGRGRGGEPAARLSPLPRPRASTRRTTGSGCSTRPASPSAIGRSYDRRTRSWSPCPTGPAEHSLVFSPNRTVFSHSQEPGVGRRPGRSGAQPLMPPAGMRALSPDIQTCPIVYPRPRVFCIRGPRIAASHTGRRPQCPVVTVARGTPSQPRPRLRCRSTLATLFPRLDDRHNDLADRQIRAWQAQPEAERSNTELYVGLRGLAPSHSCTHIEVQDRAASPRYSAAPDKPRDRDPVPPSEPLAHRPRSRQSAQGRS